jgi:hypothetical protein
MAVFIQITFHSRLIRGHQLFPGFIAASVCISPDNLIVSSQIVLFLPLITQRETEFWYSESAFHIAIANSQIFNSSLSLINSRGIYIFQVVAT